MMGNEKNKYPIRKRTRLKEYDYSNNAYYFITICVNDKREVFGKIENNSVSLNDYGILIEKYLFDLSERFKSVEIDYYVIMPNHFHCILILVNESDKSKRKYFKYNWSIQILNDYRIA